MWLTLESGLLIAAIGGLMQLVPRPTGADPDSPGARASKSALAACKAMVVIGLAVAAVGALWVLGSLLT